MDLPKGKDSTAKDDSLQTPPNLLYNSELLWVYQKKIRDRRLLLN